MEYAGLSSSTSQDDVDLSYGHLERFGSYKAKRFMMEQAVMMMMTMTKRTRGRMTRHEGWSRMPCASCPQLAAKRCGAAACE